MKRAIEATRPVTFECTRHGVRLESGDGGPVMLPGYVGGANPFAVDDPSTLEQTGEWFFDLSYLTCPGGDDEHQAALDAAAGQEVIDALTVGCADSWRIWVGA